MGLVRQVVDTLGIVTLDLAGFEADDIIATVVEQAKARGDEVIIVTGDRDAYQLVEDPLVKVLYNRRGVSDYALYDEAGIFERTGVTPAQYPEYAALRGDPSDNLPGVPGVGEKTAAKLITTYGGLDGIFANLDVADAEAAGVAGRARGAGAAERRRDGAAARRARSRSTSTTLSWGPTDMAEVKRLFDFLEFRSLFERLDEVLDARIAAPVVGRRRGAGGRGRPVRRRPPAAAAALAGPSRARRGGGVGRRRRAARALIGLAVVLDADDGDGRLDPGRAASTITACGRR